MRKVVWFALAPMVVLVGAPLAAGEEAAGKQLFLANKCNVCHAVEAAAIAVAEDKSAAADEEEEAPAKDAKEVKPPDLSGVGKRHDAAFIDGFLRKKETIDGRKHRRRFKGTPEERKVLVDWLMELKTPAKSAG